MCIAIRNLELKAGPARIGGGAGWAADGMANMRQRRAPITSRRDKDEALHNVLGRHALIRQEGGGDAYDQWSMTTGSRSTPGFGRRQRKPGFFRPRISGFQKIRRDAFF